MKKTKILILMLAIFAMGGFFVKAEDAPNWLWVQKAGMGGAGFNQGNKICVDSDYLYTVGVFEYDGIFGSTTLTSSGSADIFVSKMSSAGAWVWTKKAGGTLGDYGKSIAVDAQGNSYVVGSFQDTISLGDITLTSSGSNDIFVAKLSSTGAWLWAQKAGGTSSDVSASVSTNGDIYIVGYFQDTASFGNITLTSTAPSAFDAFVAKLSSTGTWIRATKSNGVSHEFGYGISAESSGSAYVVGNFQGTTSFGDTTLLNSGGNDIFVAKLSSTGAWLWAQKAGGTSWESCNGIAIDAQGNSYIAGVFQGSASFGDIVLTSAGGNDVFVSKLTSTGAWVRSQKGGGTSYEGCEDIKIDAQGNSYIAGNFQGTAPFGATTLVSSGQSDILIAKLSSTGTWLWAKKAGGTTADTSYGLNNDTNGNVYAVGYFQNAASFDSISITGASIDIFIAKLGLPPLFSYFNGGPQRENVGMSSFNFGTSRKSSITLGNAYTFILNFINNLGGPTDSTKKLETPFHFKAPVQAGIGSGSTGNATYQVKFFTAP